MKIKSYYSRTVEDAIAARAPGDGAGRDAGEQPQSAARKCAISASTKWSSPIVAVPARRRRPRCSFRASRAMRSGSSAPTGDRLSVEVAELKKELEGMRRAHHPHGLRAGAVGRRLAGRIRRLCRAHRGRGVAGTGARDRAGRRRSRATATGPRSAARPAGRMARPFSARWSRKSASRFTVDADAGPRPAQPRIVALVGPPGSGKTTTLVKLAVNYGLAARRPVLLLSMDTLSRRRRRPTAVLRRDSRRRFSVAGDGAVAGADDRGKPRQGTDLHRYPGLGLRRSGGFREPGALSRHARRYRHAPGPSGIHEGRRPVAHGGRVRDLAAATSAVHQARRNRILRADLQRSGAHRQAAVVLHHRPAHSGGSRSGQPASACWN